MSTTIDFRRMGDYSVRDFSSGFFITDTSGRLANLATCQKAVVLLVSKKVIAALDASYFTKASGRPFGNHYDVKPFIPPTYETNILVENLPDKHVSDY